MVRELDLPKGTLSQRSADLIISDAGGMRLHFAVATA